MASSGLSIGLTGLLISQRSLQTIGHNLANVNTPGYSRQVNSLSARDPLATTYGVIGQGVTIDEIKRIKDDLINSQIQSYTSLSGSAEVQNRTLKTLEGIFNELSEFSLSNSIEKFFQSIHELTLNPEFITSRYQLLQDGIKLANTVGSLDEQFIQLMEDNAQEIITKVTELNDITGEIAQLNKRISAVELGTGNANDLKDRRDALVTKLSKLADIKVINNSNGTINVLLGGTFVVHENNTEALSTESTGLGTVSIDGIAALNSGALKGLLDLQDVLLIKYRQRLDTLAASIIKEVNNIHSEGLGLNGGFGSLSSTNAVTSTTVPLSSSTSATGLPFATTAGDLYVNVTDSTGNTIKTKLTIGAAETLTTLDAQIDGIANLTGSVGGGILTITAAAGYTFDFSKDLAFSSAVNTIGGGTSTATLSGYYNGSDNDTFTLTATTPGTIGSGSTAITVTDSGGATLAVLDVGSSYTGGDVLQIADGVSISFDSGTIGAAPTLSFYVTNDPDTTNVLSALGLNTFFSGKDASTIDVTQYIKDDVSRIAAASSSSPGDNTNALRLAALQDSTSTNNTTFSEYLHGVVAELGIDTQQKESEKESFSSLLLNLENQRQEISGVSIEEEMINIIRFQQAFQASARYVSVIAELSDILMSI
jgi:flagellar hook-associated protein 1 FlgK